MGHLPSDCLSIAARYAAARALLQPRLSVIAKRHVDRHAEGEKRHGEAEKRHVRVTIRLFVSRDPLACAGFRR